MISPTDTLLIERLSPENLADLAALHQAVYQRSPAPDYFPKKYDTAYTGAKYMGYLAYNEALQPVAFYGVIPTLLWHEGKSLLAAQSADTMTHPGYRGLGLFVRLANHTYTLCKLEGVRLVFGFPNQNSLPGFLNKLNWHCTEIMEHFEVPVKPMFSLEKIAGKFPSLQPAYRHYQQRVLKPYLRAVPGIANSVVAEGFNGVFRDDQYLKYKAYSDTQVIQVDRSLFWIKLKNGLHIGDISNVETDFDTTLKKLQRLAGKLGVSVIRFQTSPGTNLHRLFAARFEPLPTYHIIFKPIDDGIATDRIKFTFADIDVF
ncbi:GNAT family N-acetyltransferase [Mucilaginibacter sp. dw_454]|uniref:GNAT family N-acetyltransferase n=1 Tax=Mucilaginibacter sp. dw_454 TaxID=2720079 RepID=UPI001BD3911C|nr:GNAT family N-acetyltransferase [Mucilaginibacter sp. dw_454]